MDDLVREENPSLLRKNLHQIPFDFDRIGLPGQVQPPRDTLDMGIDHHSGRNAKSRA
jgi:hypothetical protein